jgi:hypothetical protein
VVSWRRDSGSFGLVAQTRSFLISLSEFQLKDADNLRLAHGVGTSGWEACCVTKGAAHLLRVLASEACGPPWEPDPPTA